MQASAPWWFKIVVKIIFSRLPIRYDFWKKFGIFKHGAMDNYEYSIKTFNDHINYSELNENLSKKVILEIGPGDSIATSFLAHSYGAKSILVDSGKFVEKDLSSYHSLLDKINSQNDSLSDISLESGFEELLTALHSQYLVDGLDSLKLIDSSSVDLIFSQAVMEHIRKDEINDTINEFYRILKPGGVTSHRIDYKDHLNSSINNLRFSGKIWESNLFANSGFYTNRIRHSEMIKLFSSSNLILIKEKTEEWSKVPLNRKKLNKAFKSLTEKDLLTKSSNILYKKSI